MKDWYQIYLKKHEKLYLLFLVILFVYKVEGQQISNTSNNWYFGLNAGVNFNTNPVSINLDGQMNTQEGVASISDGNGSLLFYTDGINVWDRTHAILNTTELNGHISTTQSALIVPNIDDPYIYYIFTVDELGKNNGLQYSELDISLPGNGTMTDPLGELVSGKINIDLVAPIAEKVTAVIKHDNSGYWVITHGWDNNEFYVFSVDCEGVNPTPLVFSVGNVHTGGNLNINSVGYMKSNITGDKLAVVNRNIAGVELFDFDSLTGEISNPTVISVPNESLYGIEFDFNSKYLFISGTFKILRYNIESQLLDEIQNTNGTLFSDNYIRALQLGPDKKIYVSVSYTNYLSVIENYDSDDAALSINHLHLDPNDEDRSAVFGLPNIFYFDFFKKDTTKVRICPDEFFSLDGFQFAPNTVNMVYTTSSVGCDSSYILQVDTFLSYEVVQQVEVCVGDFYTHDGVDIFPGETVDFIFNTVDNCDSVIFISVIESDNLEIEIDTFLCQDERLFVKGIEFNTAIDTTLIISSTPCDSIIQLSISKSNSPNIEIVTTSSCYSSETGQIALEIENDDAEYSFSIDGLNFSSNTTYTGLAAGDYVVYVKDQFDCLFTFETIVEEDGDIDLSEEVFLPNVFNPNSLVNNCFKIFSSSDLDKKSFNLTVYDRWGNLMFQSFDLDDCWDGNFNNVPVEIGVYVWVLKYEGNECTNDGEITLLGDVTVLR